ncbi:type II toxin-antitoxin system RelE/ParE family toxin [Suttonella ornithocola]|uniref:Putative addiction module killer protein n=1 Tax=Suttonella ornithocola TaxID=279832 RepID=A0A380MV51_9GAMM|nr:type II toxin-antitoxin system RelE/ParE family toxin [Suttonella ornithocola]SUO96152.1 putative addiction module killer protein [Suttonella ornithocola]
MYEIRRLPSFDKWIQGLKDKTTKIRIIKRLEKLERGVFGDHKQLSNDVWELREHFGAGYRLYYTIRGKTVIIMLGGGNKSTQAKDIESAKQLIDEIED